MPTEGRFLAFTSRSDATEQGISKEAKIAAEAYSGGCGRFPIVVEKGPELAGFLDGARVRRTTIAVLRNPNNPAEDNLRSEEAVARTIGQRILTLNASTAAEIEQAFAAIARERADALLVNTDALFTAERERLVALAARHRVPAIYAWREFVEAGGLMSYGTNLNRSYHQVGIYVGRILKSDARYYDTARTHRSLDQDAPISRPVQQIGRIVSHALVGGLHHQYVRI
jgi:hypothetical protein